MDKELTQRQKVIEVQRKVKNHLKNTLEPKMMKDIEDMIMDEQRPRHWYNLTDMSFYISVIKKHIKL